MVGGSGGWVGVASRGRRSVDLVGPVVSDFPGASRMTSTTANGAAASTCSKKRV